MRPGFNSQPMQFFLPLLALLYIFKFLLCGTVGETLQDSV